MKRMRIRELEQECQSFLGQPFYYPQTYPLKYKLRTKCAACGKRNDSRDVLLCDGRFLSVCSRCGDRQAVTTAYLHRLEHRRNNRVAWAAVLLSLVGLALAVALIVSLS